MDQAVLAQNGPVLEARSGVCLLIPIYAPASKMGAIIHLYRNDELWNEQADLIRKVFGTFPQLCLNPHVGFVSSQEVKGKHPKQLHQAKELILALAPGAMLVDILVGSKDAPNADPEMVAQDFDMSVEICLGTYAGKLLILDDYDEHQQFDWSS